ncbi:MAG: hypothetical protein IMY86_11405 [Chloroflexi bacterium]|nr:hypothetical protein [Chloroflexota bacterium]
MNPEITAHFDRLERRLLESSAVSSYTLMRREVTPTDGKVRIRAQLRDGGLLELLEYVALNIEGQVARLKYSYHWQNKNGILVRRWDAAPHHPELPCAPHHVHLPDGDVEAVAEPPTATEVLVQIEASLSQGQKE